MERIVVRIVTMPDCVKGVTMPSSDGIYNIYINANYTKEMQYKIYKHELSHINKSDFYNFDKIETIENRAKEIAN